MEVHISKLSSYELALLYQKVNKELINELHNGVSWEKIKEKTSYLVSISKELLSRKSSPKIDKESI